ncbi:hypothetical protein B0T26DRAFT_748621 [Lasiosphaeria miniovina]|uniref:Uncharacterized protein n=1 Tax=Lasiosphaeria miniovina TaxID=1954250 RepID=A0AA40E8Y9_9PEZI|nr:uncharacterized protein B0T26DRAFT_748621 [Lasiosphaeria miniovina]KAK0728391.1 hypothetical protein B0T26DRAFT_748621 [Lasiosphaeria miniovina]
MASTEILSQTLSTITSIKLDQLRKQKEAYETKKHTLLRDVALETDSQKLAKSLLEGTAKLPSMAANPGLSAANLKRFVEQAAYDPSVSEVFLHDYEAALRNELQVQSNKFDFATLYGRLINEWIASGKGSGDATEYVSVGRDESHEQQSSKDVKHSLDSLRDSMKEFQKEWDGPERHFDDEVLTNCLNGMLRVDLLSDEKRATLRGFLGNKVVLSEIADVLNMRMSTRSSWAWDAPLVV